MSETFDQDFWEEQYRSRAAVWSGKPNRHLVSEVSQLSPGTALDAGCGEGADAIWLAGRGWRVTAVDLSPTAVERAAAIAAAAGDEVAERIDWLQADLATWDLAERRFDLVSAQYVHLPSGRRQLWQRLAAAVTPGGSLLICGHHPSDLHTTMQRPHHPELYFTGADVLAALEPANWEIVTNAAPERTATAPDGHDVTIRDTVFHARRRT